MSYLVLARKWRPRDFESLVGQEHVVRALTHALSTQRLHHAWLFTGTRGVGKTTLSRILAKSLNCESGITARPCGTCSACTQIDAGRFVDYVELDAASNRGVDEMTQLLEQAVYAPTSARFKVYMIDEVHMLTGHAFNAMLKTLEEPPAHVKFILATTDPQKIPPTVLSRCLQFNLKQMAPDAIASHLSWVLEQENVPFEAPALRLIGQAASGSMRDALSLTDQAIAFSSGDLTVAAIRAMLGSVDQTLLIQLLQALCQGQAAEVLDLCKRLSERGLSLRSALGDLAVLLSRIAIVQRVGSGDIVDDPDQPAIEALASGMSADLVQLFYTVAVHSRQELAQAPDEFAGFVMICLRMLGFVDSLGDPQKKSHESPPRTTTLSSQPVAGARASIESPAANQSDPDRQAVPARGDALDDPAHRMPLKAPDMPVIDPVGEPVTAPAKVDVIEAALHVGERSGQSSSPASQAARDACMDIDIQMTRSDQTDPELDRAQTRTDVDQLPPWESAPDAQGGFEATVGPQVDADSEPIARSFDSVDPVPLNSDQNEQQGGVGVTQQVSVELEQPQAVTPHAEVAASHGDALHAVGSVRLQSLPELWATLALELPVSGMARQLAMQSVCVHASDQRVLLRVQTTALAKGPHLQRFSDALRQRLGQPVQLEIEVGAFGETLSAQQVQDKNAAQRLEQARQDLESDPFVQVLIRDMGAQIVPGSIRPGKTGDNADHVRSSNVDAA